MKKLLFNPYHKFSINNLVIAGSIITIIGSLLGYCFNVRFDGMLDMHSSPTKAVLIQQPFIDNIVNIISIFTTLFISAKIINKQTAYINVLLASIIYRVPLYVLPFSNFKNKIVIVSEEIKTNILTTLSGKQANAIPVSDYILFYSFTVISMLLLIWSIALLYNGFKQATAGKGALQIILFIVSIIIGEIISKIIINFVPY